MAEAAIEHVSLLRFDVRKREHTGLGGGVSLSRVWQLLSRVRLSLLRERVYAQRT